MANVVYVGNYPNTFTDDDVINIFSDFDGLVLLRSVRKNLKCYSFILCTDQEQVLDVVLTLNDTEVGGRNLVVRASDDELQEIIEEIEDEEYDESQSGELEGQQFDDYSSYSTLSDNNAFRQPQKQSHIASKFEERNSTKNDGSSSNSRPHFKRPGLYRDNVESLEAVHNQDFETASCASYATSRGGRLSPGSTTSQFSKTDRRGERFSFVSAINFRNGTTAEELEDLFADYSPYKIIMRFPNSSKEQPTEAIACFLKSKNAYEAILNLDNTVHKGRVLLVSECDDISYIQDLIRVHNIR